MPALHVVGDNTATTANAAAEHRQRDKTASAARNTGNGTGIFKKLIADLQPKYFIAFSSKIAEVLHHSFEHLETKVICNGNKEIAIKRGRFKEKMGSGKFIYIPHPNYPLTSSARKEAWNLLEL